ncbi:MAG: BamA/TamA family outer membrane protein [Candidatus Margulisbacteria bacterium]|nr:BamA/TamA family outer membrane protein [Candidatus Margulisiibacteriota bacterium]
MKFAHFNGFLQKNRKKIKNFTIKDPALLVLFQLDKIIAQPLDDSYIPKLKKFIKSLPANYADKPYLMLIFIKALGAKGRLSKLEMKKCFDKLIEKDPNEIAFYESYAELQLSRKQPYLAVEVMGIFFKKQVGLKGAEKKLQGVELAEVLAKKVKRGDWLNKFADYLVIWAGHEESISAKRNLLLAAEKCYLRAIEIDSSEICQFVSASKLGELNFQLAILAQKCEDEVEVRLEQAIEYYEKAQEIAPKDVQLWLKLGDAYTLRAIVDGDEEDLQMARDCYVEAAALEKNPTTWLKLCSAYAKLGEFEKAREKLGELINADPDNYLLYTLLGDMSASDGKLGEAVKAYEQAFQKAKKAKNPTQAYTEVYQKLVMLKVQARMKLAKINVRYSPNPLKIFVRMVGDLLYFLNPFNIASFLVNSPKMRKYGKKELEDFLKQTEELGKKSWKEFRKISHDVNFYLANLLSLINLRRTIKDQIKGTKQAMVDAEIIQGLKEVELKLRQQIKQNAYMLLKNDKLLQKAWEKALGKKNIKQLIVMLKDSAQNYLSVTSLLSTKASSKYVTKVNQGLWKTLEDRLGDALGYAEDNNDIEMAFAAFKLVSQLAGGVETLVQLEIPRQQKIEEKIDALKEQFKKGFDNLEEEQKMLAKLNSLKEQGKKIEDKLGILKSNQKKLGELLKRSLEEIIEIAKKKKDYKSLLEFAKDYEHLGDISYVSLKAAKEVAVEAKGVEELKQIADLAYALSKEAEGFSKPLGQAYRELCISAYQGLLKIYKGEKEFEKYLEAAAQLWALGEFEEAIEAVQFLEKAAKVKETKFFLLLTLAYMHLAVDKKKKAKECFQAALKLSPGNENVLKEIQYINKKGALPTDMIIESNDYFPAHVLRANAILCNYWTKKTSYETVAEFLEKFHEAHGLKAEVKITETPKKTPVVKFNISKVVKIKIIRGKVEKSSFSDFGEKEDQIWNALIKEGYIDEEGGLTPKFNGKRKNFKLKNILSFRQETKVFKILLKARGSSKAAFNLWDTDDKAILRELGYGGVKVGGAYKQEEIEQAINSAANRLNSYQVINWKTVEENGEVTVKIEIMEMNTPYLIVGGGGGNLGAKVFIDGGVRNLFGGGEKLGVKIDYSWFYGGGYESFSLFQGKIYYKDPHIFCIGEKYPVLMSFSAERYARREFGNDGKEIVNAGQIALGVNLTPNTSLSISPDFQYIQADSKPNYFKQGFKIDLTYDGRNRWLFPTAGHILSVYVEPGVYYGGVATAGYVEAGIVAQKYFALPLDTTLMVGVKGGIGTNLFAADNFFMGEGYVRGGGDLSKFGPAIAAGTLELRSPVFNLGEYGEYGKLQPYIFGDVGAVFKSPKNAALGWGVGAGIRVALPLLGTINLYYAFPGGFGFMVGSIYD